MAVAEEVALKRRLVSVSQDFGFGLPSTQSHALSGESGKGGFIQSFFVAAAFALALSGCGGGANGGSGAGGSGVTTGTGYTVGGSASGVAGTVVLQDNGGDNLAVSANGSFTFATKVAHGNAYNVTVLTQPAGQTCVVSNGTGTALANVSNVAVSCVAAGTASSYSVGGAISGLTGSVVLQNNAGDDLTVSADGKFTFATNVVNGNTYNITIRTQPVGQTCSVSNGFGTVSGNNVANVAVVCSTNTYRVWGVVSGLTGSVVLQNNNGDNITLSANGSFTFATMLPEGSSYSVTVLAQPAGQSCSVANGTGTIAGSNITNIVVTCTSYAYTVGGTVTGLSGSMVLQDNGGDNLTVSTSGTFTFATAVATGNPYNVTVLTQPAGQLCTVTGGSGTVSANVSSVAVTCSASVSGGVAGLMGGAVQGTALALAGAVTTYAGTGTPGWTNGTGTSASFGGPRDVTTDGTNLYVLDTLACQIRQIVIATGAVTLLAGSPTAAIGMTNGTGTAALFNVPYGITTDGTNLYVADTTNSQIRKIVIATGVVTLLAGSPTGAAGSADGIGTSATFNQPQGITTDGTNLYVTDWSNNNVRKIVIATGVVTTLAGSTGGAFGLVNAAGTAARFRNPRGITTDGTNLYVVDTGNQGIRKIVIATGAVTLLAGSATGASGSTDGTGTAALFSSPWGVTTDGTNLYVTEFVNNIVRKIVIATGVVTTLAGTAGQAGLIDGTGPAAWFKVPAGLTTDGTSLYVTDSGNSVIRKIQ